MQEQERRQRKSSARGAAIPRGRENFGGESAQFEAVEALFIERKEGENTGWINGMMICCFPLFLEEVNVYVQRILHY